MKARYLILLCILLLVMTIEPKTQEKTEVPYHLLELPSEPKWKAITPKIETLEVQILDPIEEIRQAIEVVIQENNISQIIDNFIVQEVAKSVYKYCQIYNNVEYSDVLSVISVETGCTFNPYAEGSSKDRGLMQIIPPTEKNLAKNLGLENYDIFDIDTNIQIGVYYLSILKSQYKDLAFILYNQGYKEDVTDPTLYSRHINNEKSYLSKVTKYKNRYKELLNTWENTL